MDSNKANKATPKTGGGGIQGFLARLPEKQRPSPNWEPQDRKIVDAVTEPVEDHRVADDYEMATALGMDPSVWKYSQTDDCPPKHLAQLARQEVSDLQKVVQTNAISAAIVRQEQQQ